tara:strand:+ start:9869 stop:10213 length:345 start_codon:yes stop_codon:yes gene_type:complete
MPSSKKIDSKFVDDFMIFFDSKLETTPIKDIIISHINIKEYEKQEKRKKDSVDNPPKKLWKRNKKISNIDILSYFQKKNIDNNINNNNIKELYNSSNKEKKIYSNNKRSVMYIK